MSEQRQTEISQEAARDLIPWYVNGTLSADERAAVDHYASTSNAFRQAIKEERRLMSAMLARDDQATSDQSQWERLAGRITMPEAQNTAPAAKKRRVALRWPALRVIGLGSGVVALLAVVILLRPASPDDATFRTLTTESLATGVLRVKPVADVTPEQLNALFEIEGLTLVDGPSPTGIYTLQPAQDTPLAEAAARLTSAPQIAFVAVRTQ